jgi:hypothetical protein
MNARLHSLLTDAESRLAPEEQDVLADMLEAFLTNREKDPALSADEVAHLKRIAGEPFEAAPAEDVAAYFRHGA